MSVSTNEQLLEAGAELRALFPAWRMGQLMANLVTAAGGTDAGAIWDVEDEQLLVAANRPKTSGAEVRKGSAVLEPRIPNGTPEQ